jgi:hypothetical protein
MSMTVDEALARLVATAATLPGQFRPEFELGHWSGVADGADAWYVSFEGDIDGDDGGSEFTITGPTAQDVLVRAADEAWRRVPGGDPR